MRLSVCSLAVIGLSAGVAFGQAQIVLLPQVSRGDGAASMSADGQFVTVVNSAGATGGLNITRWTPGGTTTTSGEFSSQGVMRPTAISRNGQHIAGVSGANSYTQVFVAGTEGAGSVTFSAPSPTRQFAPYAISESGRYVAGSTWRNTSLPSVFRYDVLAGAFAYGQEYADSNYFFRFSGHAVSDNGVVAGSVLTNLAGAGFSFRFDTNGYSVLRSGHSGAGPVSIWVAQDGSEIIDAGGNNLNLLRWTVQGGTNHSESFGNMSIAPNPVVASPSATRIISGVGLNSRIWYETATPGVWDFTPLNTWLTAAGVALAGWSIEQFYALSDDATTIVGSGSYLGTPGTFVVYGVPAPSAAAALALGGLFAARRRR